MPKETSSKQGPRPFWSGTIAFGLVSVPVSLFAANRPRRTSLRMVDERGTPLSRRYFCPKDERPLDYDEIVRGYEVAQDEFVVVEDEELEALAPEKSHEIDLKRFVERSEIDPIYFERAYFLAPDRGAVKAYRLLARTMEEADRAGIATFVMAAKSIWWPSSPSTDSCERRLSGSTTSCEAPKTSACRRSKNPKPPKLARSKRR